MSTPREQWQITDALVYSVDWIDPSRYDEGHYNVVYSYKAGDERYTGQFADFYSGDSPLHPNDTISIRYCPEHPAKSYYPDAARPAISRGLMFAVGATAGVIAMVISYFVRKSH